MLSQKTHQKKKVISIIKLFYGFVFLLVPFIIHTLHTLLTRGFFFDLMWLIMHFWNQCVLPENIYTHHTDGIANYAVVGVVKAKLQWESVKWNCTLCGRRLRGWNWSKTSVVKVLSIFCKFQFVVIIIFVMVVKILL